MAVPVVMQPAVVIPSADWMTTFSHGPAKRDKGWSFQKCPRFCEDGTTRIANFVNLDEAAFAQRHPSQVHSAPADLDTSTHPKVQERLCERVHQAPEMSMALQDTPKKVATVSSRSQRYGADRAWLGNDTRFPHLNDPYAKKLGPGSYSPGRSPAPSNKAAQVRNSAAFNGPERNSAKYLGPFVKGPSAVYIEPDAAHDVLRTASIGHALRDIDARDWRHAARCTEAKSQQGFREPQNGGGWEMDKTGHSTSMASMSNIGGHNVAGVAMHSQAPRLVILPHERTGDLRVAHCTEHEQLYPTNQNLGPGVYAEPTAQPPGKKSYRMYSSTENLPTERPPARDKMPKLTTSLSKIEQRHKAQQLMSSAQLQALAASIKAE